MEMYDEDVTENVFFKTLQHNQSDLFEKATSIRCIICIPRQHTFGKDDFTRADFEDHIFYSEPSEENEIIYTSLSSKNVHISNNVITTDKGYTEGRTVPILFDETFFNKAEESYQVLCINQPLEGASAFDDAVANKQRVTLHYLKDCENLLWKQRGEEKLGAALGGLHRQFQYQLKNLKDCTFDRCLDLARHFYQRGYAMLLKDKYLKKRMQTEEGFVDSVKAALESYLFHRVYKQLFMCLATSLAARDSRLNKITRNMRDLQLKDLYVRPEYCQNVPRGRKEMSNMERYTTPLGKLICLRRVFRVLMQGKGDRSAIPLTSDDLLPIVVFIVVKADMPYWWATFRYMTSFRFSRSSNDDDLGFFLATLEAALEHISSKQLLTDLEQRSNTESDSSQGSGKGTSLWHQQDQHKSRCQVFFQMIRQNDVEGARKLIREKLSPLEYLTDQELCHPLCECGKCKQNVARRRQAREDVNVTVDSLDERGLSALHVAASCGHTNVIDWLISEGVEVNVKDVQGQTPLHIACIRGKQGAALLLLHLKAMPNMQDNEGNTALHQATLHCHEDCVKALIYYDQAATTLDLDVANDFGDRPLHLAAKWGYYRICEILLENGASTEACNRKNLTAKDIAHNLKLAHLLSRDIVRGINNRRHSTPAKMISSALDKRPDSVSKSVDSDVTEAEEIHDPLPNKKSFAKVDRLLKAVLDEDLPLVQFLLGWNAEFDTDVSTPELKSLCHPLCQCEKCAPLQKFSTSSQSDLHINSQNIEGVSALHVAAQCGCTEMAHLFLQRGAEVNLTTRAGVTPLHLAVKNQRNEVIDLLLKNRSDVTMADIRYNTALHLAALVGNDRAVTALLDYGASVNAENLRGNTPLHEAARAGHVTCARVLMTYGADVRAQNKNGLRPINMARNEQMRHMLRCVVSVKPYAHLDSALSQSTRSNTTVNLSHDASSGAILKSSHVTGNDQQSRGRLERSHTHIGCSQNTNFDYKNDSKMEKNRGANKDFEIDGTKNGDTSSLQTEEFADEAINFTAEENGKHRTLTSSHSISEGSELSFKDDFFASEVSTPVSPEPATDFNRDIVFEPPEQLSNTKQGEISSNVEVAGSNPEQCRETMDMTSQWENKPVQMESKQTSANIQQRSMKTVAEVKPFLYRETNEQKSNFTEKSENSPQGKLSTTVNVSSDTECLENTLSLEEDMKSVEKKFCTNCKINAIDQA